jgi:peptidoglycan/xylan/chitin deacetylase (PgdA/CDA1 family)
MKLPVLMYHNIIDEGKPDFLNISVSRLEEQFRIIKSRGFNTIGFTELQSYLLGKSALPAKALMISFDDGYASNFRLLYPLLRRYDLKANIFLVAQFINRADLSEKPDYLTVAQITEMDSRYAQFAYHSFDHKNYNNLSPAEIEDDIGKMITQFEDLKIPLSPFFAYPYGVLPKNDAVKMKLIENIFVRHGILGAFRIGNRINKIPFARRFAIERIDVRGEDPLWKFKLMLGMGRKLVP